MRIVALLVCLLLAGCGGQGERNANKGLDRPVPPTPPAEKK